jgi:hypothetical protein
MGYYAAYCDNSLLTFPDNLSVPSSRPKNSKRILKPLVFLIPEDKPIGCAETSVNNSVKTYRSHLQESRNLRKVEFLYFVNLQDGTDRSCPKAGKGYYH